MFLKKLLVLWVDLDHKSKVSKRQISWFSLV